MADPAVISQAYATARGLGASQLVLEALFRAGQVESGWENLTYGMDDSEGYLQQRPSQGWPDVRNVATATTSFVAYAQNLEAQYAGRPGDLAQAVQRSGAPERYNLPEEVNAANEYLAQASGGQVTGSPGGAPGGLTGAPGGDAGEEEGGLLASLLSPALMALLERAVAAGEGVASKAKVVEGVATTVTHAFLPSSLLRAAAGFFGLLTLGFSLWFLGREIA